MGRTATRRQRRNRSWPETLKREIVAASFAPGSSVSVVARRYDVNTNQVFSWRKLFRDGLPHLVLRCEALARPETVGHERHEITRSAAPSALAAVPGDGRLVFPRPMKRIIA